MAQTNELDEGNVQNKFSKLNGIFSGKGKQNKYKKGKPYTPEDIDVLHHKLMMHYGWIPFEEFNKLTDYQVFTMIEHCNKEDENEYNKFRLLIKAITGKDIGK